MMQIQGWLILFYFFYYSHQLSCTIYDYTSSTVKCVNTCPLNTTFIQNNCLRFDQYITPDGQVHQCQGYVSSNHLLCCNSKSYIFNGSCLKCNGHVYFNGTLCCSYDQYVDFTITPTLCKKINEGACSSMSFQQQFKVCCPSNLFYNIYTKTCTNSSGNNCDQTNKICCPNTQKLQYVNEIDEFICVSNCNWMTLGSSNFYCQLMNCNQNLQTLKSSPNLRLIYKNSFFNQSNKSLISFYNGQCCYGLSTSNICFLTQVDCGQRFMNLGWSVCCPSAFFYNLTTKNCSDTCNGYVLFSFICVSNGSYLDLTGVPKQTSNQICNNQKILPNQPYCCPSNFYINENAGCTFCNGNIYQIGAQQICCLKNYYFVLGQGCFFCDGHLDASGTICCFANQYIRYSISGTPSCVSNCVLDNIYNTQYCCDSLSNSSCNINNFQPTICSIQYYVPNTCQACPTFCSNINTCSLSTSQGCSSICLSNTVYYNSLNSCLSCDVSCSECTAPFSNSFCLNCAKGFTYVGGNCIKCGAACLQCFGSSSNCTSCDLNSQNSYLSNGNCLRVCEQSFYYIDTTQQCDSCNFSCVQCIGPSSSDCTKCQIGYYLNSIVKGSCIKCSSQCSQCQGSSTNCSACKNGLYLNLQNNSCVFSCSANQMASSWSDLNICLLCHPQCATCKSVPQNCLTCFYNTQYLNESLGVAICTNCISPCNYCSSFQNCTSCIDGYFLNNLTLKCLICNSQCKTCYGPLNSNCLSCFGDSILFEGQCSGCSSSCQTCDANKNCLQCLSSFYLYQNSCVKNCPNGTFGSNNTCNLCYSQCKTCTNESNNGCLSCNIPNILVNGSCVGCSLNCKVCSANNTCTQCNSNYYLYQQNCITSCPNKTYQNSSSCLTCPIQCTKCLNNSYCTECNFANSILFKNMCLNSCPSGYYINGSTCTYNNASNNTNNTNQSLAEITDQTIILSNNFLWINLYFSNSTNISYISQFIKVYLVDQDTSETLKLNTSVQQVDINYKKVKLISNIPKDAIKYQLTSSIVEQNSTLISSTYISSMAFSQFLINDYQKSSISNIKYIGIFISSLALLASLFAKGKDHFIAQQANTLILNVISFIQTLYFYSFINIQSAGLHNFFYGFGFSNLYFFPNFFYSTIPSDYIEHSIQKSLNPDANIFRNAGFTFSFQLVVVALVIICCSISYLYYIGKKTFQMPYIRKIMRISAFLFFLGYMNQLFFAWAQIIQPSTIQNQYQSFYLTSIGVSITIIFIIPLIMIAIIYHFYATYNSDVLQHYYTLREGSQYALIYFSTIVMAFSIGKPLVSLFLIPLQLIWIAYGYILYKYGQGYSISDYLKFIICGVVICVGYLILALNDYINWIVIVLIIIGIIFILLIYVFYQIIGLYYYQLFGKKHTK